MLPLDHPIWKELEGGYRTRFDASAVLRELFEDEIPEGIWKVLWDNLHHQGDVGDASYAAVPYLVRWIEQSDKLDENPIAMIAVIEKCRQQNNPVPRPEIAESYFSAIQQAAEALIRHKEYPWTDRITAVSIWLLSTVKGNINYAQFLDYFSSEDAKGWVEEEGMFNWIEQ